SCPGCRADYPAGATCRRCLSVANFDCERLAAILNSVGIDASKKNINELDRRLRLQQLLCCASQELPLRELGPSKELLAVRDALMQWAVVLCFRDYLLEDISSWLPEDVRSSLPQDVSSSLLKAASSSIGTSASSRHRAAEIRRSALRYRYERRWTCGAMDKRTLSINASKKPTDYRMIGFRSKGLPLLY